MSVTNIELWNALRTKFPNFKSITAKGTDELFSERGFEQLKNTNSQALNEFFNLSLTVYLQKIDISKVHDELEVNGFGESYLNGFGGIIKRLGVDSIKPVTPAYNNLQNGMSIDPFIVRKPTASERFFRINFDFQNLVTIQDEVMIKEIFLQQDGMNEFISGIIAQLQNSYAVQLYQNKLEAINNAINSKQTPLQDTQMINVKLSDEPTADELLAFMLTIKNIISIMTTSPMTNGFNALKFSSYQEKDRLKLLVRTGMKNEISMKLLSSTYNPDQLSLPIDIIEVANFGGLEAYKDKEYKTKVYPVYDELGTVIGFNEIENSKEVQVAESKVFYKDPNENVVAILADKGCIFTGSSGNFSVEPVRNARGLYTNYWCNAPKGNVHYDGLYNFVTFTKGK